MLSLSSPALHALTEFLVAHLYPAAFHSLSHEEREAILLSELDYRYHQHGARSTGCPKSLHTYWMAYTSTTPVAPSPVEVGLEKTSSLSEFVNKFGNSVVCV